MLTDLKIRNKSDVWRAVNRRVIKFNGSHTIAT
jgi:hypothetical protein